MKAKIFFSFFAAAAVFVSAGCASWFSDELMPGSDIEVVSRFKDEIAVLKNRAIKDNSLEKYEAAQTIIDNVDLTQIYEVGQVERIFGKYHKVGRGLYGGYYVVYRYSYGNQNIEINFWYQGDIVVKSKINKD